MWLARIMTNTHKIACIPGVISYSLRLLDLSRWGSKWVN